MVYRSAADRCQQFAMGEPVTAALKTGGHVCWQHVRVVHPQAAAEAAQLLLLPLPLLLRLRGCSRRAGRPACCRPGRAAAAHLRKLAEDGLAVPALVLPLLLCVAAQIDVQAAGARVRTLVGTQACARQAQGPWGGGTRLCALGRRHAAVCAGSTGKRSRGGGGHLLAACLLVEIHRAQGVEPIGPNAAERGRTRRRLPGT